MKYIKDLRDYIDKEIEVLKSIDLEEVDKVMVLLEKARKNENHIFICGNGGSAATASHFCCDFNKGISLNQEKKYNFECLSDNTSTMMAIANDIGYDQIFAIPLKNKMKACDILIGISGSGNSENVIEAVEYARSIGATTIALVGYDGGKLKEIVDYCIHVDIKNMQIVEDVHMMLDHVMMYILSKEE